MFTVNEIKGLKPRTNSYYKCEKAGQRGAGSLAVKVTVTGGKSLYFRYFVDKKPQFIRIGAFPLMSLSEARDQVSVFSKMLLEGIDPKEELARLEDEKQQQAKIEARKGSIGQLFTAYTEQMRKDGKRTYKAVLASLKKEVYEFIDPDKKASEVEPQDIVEILAAMIQRGAATQSNRVRSYLMAAFNYGLQHDHNPANLNAGAVFGLKYNPVAAIPKQKSAEKVGDNYLSLPELQEILNDFSSVPRVGVVPHLLLKLCVLLGGQRPYEVVASKWSAVDFENHTLLITTDISKNKKEHLIPLTQATEDVLLELETLSRGSEFIFPKTGNPEEHLRTDSLSKAIARYRDHKPEFKRFIARDLRRTVKTLMGELGVSKELRDRIQNHALNDVSSKHYDRYDYLNEKRIALQSWEQKLNGNTEKNNVVLLNKA